MEEIIRIKDKRSGRFMVDDVVLNGYGSKLGATGIAFYVVLCRYANNDTQKAYPSLTLIRNETGMDRRTIIKAADKTEELRLIKKETIPGRYVVYTLLEPKKLTSSKNATTSRTSSKITQTSSNFTHTSSKTRRERTKKRNLEKGIGYKKLKETAENLKRPSFN